MEKGIKRDIEEKKKINGERKEKRIEEEKEKIERSYGQGIRKETMGKGN